MKVLGRICLNSRKDRRKDGKVQFFLRCKRTYVINNNLNKEEKLHFKNASRLSFNTLEKK